MKSDFVTVFCVQLHRPDDTLFNICEAQKVHSLCIQRQICKFVCVLFAQRSRKNWNCKLFLCFPVVSIAWQVAKFLENTRRCHVFISLCFHPRSSFLSGRREYSLRFFADVAPQLFLRLILRSISRKKFRQWINFPLDWVNFLCAGISEKKRKHIWKANK